MPLTFNFRIPETVTIADGMIKRWYYSNSLGQVKIYKPTRDIYELVRGKLDDQTTPSIIAFKSKMSEQSNPGQEAPKNKLLQVKPK